VACQRDFFIGNGIEKAPGKYGTKKPYGGTLPKTPYVRDPKTVKTTTFEADVVSEKKVDFGKHQIYRAQKQSAPRPPVVNIIK